MDYPAIDRFMKKTGLANEPAFEFLHFLTEPIPAEKNRRILGLYFPDGDLEKDGAGYLPPSTIILPSDASEGTLLHELGHRHGHFYYNDLSELYAENYRIAQEKRLSPIYAGSYARMELSVSLASKYQVGDILLIGTYAAEYWVVLAVSPAGNPGQYVLQGHLLPGDQLNGVPFALDISFVDNNPDWHKQTEKTAWLTNQKAVVIVGVLAVGILLFSKR
ncbi:MAG: hypothetical protein Q8O55_07615 [Dehalococcoidales bacterium]|nr:hypothetical protein [Dehalococcoidales bacterium]